MGRGQRALLPVAPDSASGHVDALCALRARRDEPPAALESATTRTTRGTRTRTRTTSEGATALGAREAAGRRAQAAGGGYELGTGGLRVRLGIVAYLT